jgi:ubiquinone/menaquinone biosynthesis C-methylase UbiE
MAEMAFHRGIQVARGIGEALPFRKNFFETVLMVTVSCFLQEVERTFKEVYGILKSDHAFILGLLDKNGAFAQKYISQKSTSPVFKNAKFLSTAEVSQMLQRAGFRHLEIIQTLFSLNPKAVEKPRPGYGKGSFVVIKALKP